MLDRIAAGAVDETRKRLYAHYDYFGYIIPATWFLLGLVLIEWLLFKTTPLRTFEDQLVASFRATGSLGTLLEIAAALVLLVMLFNIVYVVGHLLNGISALLLDRTVVKKLLKYPFRLYAVKATSTGQTDHEIFRAQVLDSSYALTCINLAPLILLECSLIAFERSSSQLPAILAQHPLGTLLLVSLLALGHLGLPSRRIRRYTTLAEWTAFGRLLFAVHALTLAAFVAAVTIGLLHQRSAALLLIFPGANILLAGLDRGMRKEMDYRSPSVAYFFLYLRVCFSNWLYFLANLVDYGSMPSKPVLEAANGCIGEDVKHPSDHFWMCFINLENLAPASFPAAYHFLSMYSMNRNLSSATWILLLYAEVCILSGRALAASRAVAVSLSMALVGAAMLFLVRYLYVYSGYYSKYVLRTAAFLHSEKMREAESSGK